MIGIDKIIVIVSWISILALACLQNTKIPTLDLNLGMGLFICFIIGIVKTIGIYVIKGLHIRSKKDVLIFIIRCLHYFVNTFHMFYIFIFAASSDILYLVYVGLLILHWGIFKGECVLTYIEKKLLNANYKLGDKPYNHEWITVWATEKYMPLVLNVITLVFIYNILIVVRRSDVIPEDWQKVVIMLVIWFLFFYSSLSR